MDQCSTSFPEDFEVTRREQELACENLLKWPSEASSTRTCLTAIRLNSLPSPAFQANGRKFVSFSTNNYAVAGDKPS